MYVRGFLIILIINRVCILAALGSMTTKSRIDISIAEEKNRYIDINEFIRIPLHLAYSWNGERKH
jgi:hypothetical protein